MAKEIRVPQLGESVTEATIAQWFKQEGEAVKADEPLVELETDKVTVEVPAPMAGVLASISATPGETVNVGALIGAIEEGGAAKPADKAEARPQRPAETAEKAEPAEKPLSPAVRKLVAENKVDTASVAGSGKDGRLTKGDVLDYVAKPPSPKPAPPPLVLEPAPVIARAPRPASPEGREERVRM